MGKALYRSYRSRSFDEVLGQDHITTTLKNALEQKAISHAYLLTGPRGVGKTSVARILAFAVNDIAYNEDITHLDIIEIDAASNRRIDEIREIREKVHIAPTSGKYKVYIIDEVHMLTREAFNALLKTLEEPPAHVIFILATTEAHKVPETIISRCIRFTFKPISSSDIAKQLTAIAQKEKIDIKDEAVDLLASHSRGSFRDGISLLEQVSHIGTSIERSDVEHLIGIAPNEAVDSIIAAVTGGKIKKLEASLASAYDSGVSESMLASQLSKKLRDELLQKSSLLTNHQLMSLLRAMLGVAGSSKPKAELELALLDVVLERATPQSTDEPPKKDQEPPAERPTEEKPPKSEPVMPKIEPISTSLEGDLWVNVLDGLKKQNNTIYSIVRMAQVEQFDDVIHLSFRFPFHYKKITDSKNIALISQTIKDNGGAKIKLEIKLGAGQTPKKEEVPAKKDDSLASLTNIFGGHEVLES